MLFSNSLDVCMVQDKCRSVCLFLTIVEMWIDNVDVRECYNGMSIWWYMILDKYNTHCQFLYRGLLISL